MAYKGKKVHGEYADFKEDPTIQGEMKYVSDGKEHAFTYASSHTGAADMLLQEVGDKPLQTDLALRIKKEIDAAEHFMKISGKDDKDKFHHNNLKNDLDRVKKSYKSKHIVKGSKK